MFNVNIKCGKSIDTTVYTPRESLGEIKYHHDNYIMGLLDFHSTYEISYVVILSTLAFGLQLMFSP